MNDVKKGVNNSLNFQFTKLIYNFLNFLIINCLYFGVKGSLIFLFKRSSPLFIYSTLRLLTIYDLWHCQKAGFVNSLRNHFSEWHVLYSFKSSSCIIENLPDALINKISLNFINLRPFEELTLNEKKPELNLSSIILNLDLEHP
jgi:hypothetical protein